MKLENGRDWRRRLAVEANRWGLAPYWIIFAGALGLLTMAQLALAPLNSLWLDELFSLWASDPRLPIAESAARILPDTNPPLYPMLLRLVREVMDSPREAFLMLAALCLLCTLAFTLWTARRAGMLGLGLMACAAFVVSGPAIGYFPEGRTYFAVMCVVFALSWSAALNLAADRQEVGLSTLAGLGALAALTHVFGAIFAGSLAAALVLLGFFQAKRHLLASGLVLGASAVITLALWFSTIIDNLDRVSWIEFTGHEVRQAFWYVRNLALGPNVMALLLFALLSCGMIVKDARPYVLAFGVTLFLFVALPIAASFYTPMIVGRYLLVGAPALVVLICFVSRACLMSPLRYTKLIAGALAFLVVGATGFGFAQAKTLTATKAGWVEEATIASLAAACPASSIRVIVGWDLFYDGFSLLSGRPDDTFVKVAPGQPLLKAADAPCAVMGWAEHLKPDDIAPLEATDVVLLARMNLDARPDEVDIQRRQSGYLVLKRSQPAASPN